MGKKLNRFSIATILSVVIISIAFVYIRRQNTFVKIYNANASNIQSALGFIPSDVKAAFRVSEIEKLGNDIVIKEIRNDLIVREFSFLVYSDRGRESFLKAYPVNLLKSNLNKKTPNNWGMMAAYLIDENVFQTYVDKLGIKDSSGVIKKYCHLLSNTNDSTSYKIVNSTKDIEFLVENRKHSNTETLVKLGFQVIDISDLSFEPNFVYCWFNNKGIVKFKFDFAGGTFIKVSSESVGYLGIEVPVIP